MKKRLWDGGYDGYLTLDSSLFGAVKLVKNANESDKHGNFSFPTGGIYENLIIFEVDMISSVLVDNKKKDVLILGEGPTQGLDYTTLSAEKIIQ